MSNDVTRHNTTPTNESAVDFIKRLINAWDCCGTCAGGVLAERDRRILAARGNNTTHERLHALADEIERYGYMPEYSAKKLRAALSPAPTNEEETPSADECSCGHGEGDHSPRRACRICFGFCLPIQARATASEGETNP